ncbi:hypothetical protein OYT88_04600 [Sporolactobacillus sp. CQH2019]|uniref:hypothetical protein n=1 Tax=Sporolactobacillus sp. CQH2019 TaxID=3023512 RepID=UPI0023676623|nr:hypothetical protein [Sporolactobacillus sp. CQH2019]MDD9147829.1 hypothetical protein [Sporolactobacillus sp. CQH2019]
MKWISQDFYDNQYGGTPIQSDKFNMIANAAERTIDQITHFNLSKLDFSTLPAFIQNQVLMAISAQMEYFYEIGSHTEAGMQTVQSASIGGFHYQNAPMVNTTTNLMRSDVAINYLAPTGLMYAGVEVKNPGFDSRYGYFGGWIND